tara:strand:+ start:865 stop:1377 length:513 start_codon:yes stop_codon:yes gene_type:complete
MIKPKDFAVTNVLLLFMTLACVVSRDWTVVDPVLQWENCNNCYAVAARDVLLWHMPHLKNITLQELMEDSHQTCNGGVPTKIWNHYFHKKNKVTSITKMGLITTRLKKIINQYGPVVLNKGTNHLVTAFDVSKQGILIRDPKEKHLTIWKTGEILKESTKGLFYIAYPQN